jgi:ADP-ribose pyrophosphatase YjhB (NUDIX family)
MVNIFAIAFLYSGETILLARRCNADFGDGLYHLVGGKVEPEETARHAVTREVLEETGLDIPEHRFTLMHTLHRKGAETEFIALCFAVDISQMNTPRIMEPHKHDDMQFFTKDNLPDNIIAAHEQVIRCIQDGIRYSEHGWNK